MRLVADKLACERNGREIFRGLSFTVGEGEYLELRGANGAGKSTLLRLIAGLVPLTAGVLMMEGGDGDAPVAQQCHFAGHQEALKSALTVRENLEFWAHVLDGGAVDEALAAFSLDRLADEQASILSAGQRRRLALARLAIARRPVWLLDEPATALDAVHTEKLVGLATRHMATGGLVIAATHAEWGLVPSRTLHLGEAP